MWTSFCRNQADSAWIVGAGSRSIFTVPSSTFAGEGVLHPPPLGLDVELGQIGGRRDDDEDAQRTVDRQRSRRLGHLEVADDGGAFGLGDEAVAAPVVEQLPRQARDRRRVGEPEPQP